MNPLIFVILIPLVILGSVALNHYFCKKITKPYKTAPSFLDDLPDLHRPKKEPFWYSHKDYDRQGDKYRPEPYHRTPK